LAPGHRRDSRVIARVPPRATGSQGPRGGGCLRKPGTAPCAGQALGVCRAPDGVDRPRGDSPGCPAVAACRACRAARWRRPRGGARARVNAGRVAGGADRGSPDGPGVGGGIGARQERGGLCRRSTDRRLPAVAPIGRSAPRPAPARGERTAAGASRPVAPCVHPLRFRLSLPKSTAKSACAWRVSFRQPSFGYPFSDFGPHASRLASSHCRSKARIRRIASSNSRLLQRSPELTRVCSAEVVH
jgi:hypothetical protein